MPFTWRSYCVSHFGVFRWGFPWVWCARPVRVFSCGVRVPLACQVCACEWSDPAPLRLLRACPALPAEILVEIPGKCKHVYISGVVSLRLTDDEKNRLDALAEKTGRPRAFYIREALGKYPLTSWSMSTRCVPSMKPRVAGSVRPSHSKSVSESGWRIEFIPHPKHPYKKKSRLNTWCWVCCVK
ncbi:ribbon-helix-helix domain-containing protein [Corynebacterium marambiense]|uniref:ribbon-helix-helix domain-containing protein n=1 Tax=Corynebacterium marambiense TaxID=2765364 RepID=UPI002B1EB38A|nr:ribbon-helix-helix domain-containing protein [Corynebacterium marambiense]